MTAIFSDEHECSTPKRRQFCPKVGHNVLAGDPLPAVQFRSLNRKLFCLRLALQLIENLHRQDLHPLEEARAFQRLMHEFNLTQRDLAQRLGQSLRSINETMRPLQLAAAVLANVRTSEQISKSVLLGIAKEPDAASQRAL